MASNFERPILLPVDGITIKVDKSAKERNPFPIKEWILAFVSNVAVQKATKAGWNDQLNFEFHIKEVGMEGRKIWANTSMLMTPETRLYEFYTAIMGKKELEDGADVKISDMIGKFCYIMVVDSKKKKGKQLVDIIKFCDNPPKEEDMTETKSEKKADAIVSQDASADDGEINLEDVSLDDI